MFQRPEYQAVFQKAEAVNSVIRACRNTSAPFIRLDEIIFAVKKRTGFDAIQVLPSHFSKMPELREEYGQEARYLGGMLTTYSQNGIKGAQIYVNADLDKREQRFNIAHELGHLITELPELRGLEHRDGVYIVSTNSCADLTALPLDTQDPYLIGEQAANIFALLVLIPRNILIRDLVDADTRSLSLRYGVSEAAIYSRMLLSIGGDFHGNE